MDTAAAENGADDSEKDANDTEEGAGKEASRHPAEHSSLACAYANAINYIALCSGMFKFLNEYYDPIKWQISRPAGCALTLPVFVYTLDFIEDI